jgi:hypothetical protein
MIDVYDDDDDGECGAFGTMLIGRGNRRTKKSAPVPLNPPQIPQDLTWARTQAAVVGSQRLTTLNGTNQFRISVGPVCGWTFW